MKISIRHTKTKDYSEISDLRTKNFSNENRESIINKIKSCYEGCLVADLDGIIGYIVSFPYLIGKPHPLDNFEPIKDPNCWYIFDLCVSKEFRGKGIAKELTKAVINKKQNVFCLTAIKNSEKFWDKMGFRSFFNLEYSDKKASYMILVK